MTPEPALHRRLRTERPSSRLGRGGRLALREIVAKVNSTVSEADRGSVTVLPGPMVPTLGNEWVVSIERSRQGRIVRIDITQPRGVVYVNEFPHWAFRMGSMTNAELSHETALFCSDGGRAAVSVGDPFARAFFGVSYVERMAANRLTFTRDKYRRWQVSDRVGYEKANAKVILGKLRVSMSIAGVVPTVPIVRKIEPEDNRVGFVA